MPDGADLGGQLSAIFDAQLGCVGRASTRASRLPSTSRTHCVFWPDWSSNAEVELAHGIRLDANYYHYPGAWIGSKPGFMNGGGFPMRFADLNGTPIDVWQQNTNMNDEATTAYQTHIDTLLDNAIGPKGYFGAFGMNMHTDNAQIHPGSEAVVAAAQARGVPVISYKQLLDWVDGRDSSTIRGLSWSAGTLTFMTTVGAGADRMQRWCRSQGPSGTLSAESRAAAQPVPYTVQTIKGIEYAVFAGGHRHVHRDVRLAGGVCAPTLGGAPGLRELGHVENGRLRELGEIARASGGPARSA